MARGLESVQDVVDAKLCSGCGACAFVQPRDIRMVDVPTDGLRPRITPGVDGRVPSTHEALAVCPGIHLEHASFDGDPPVAQEMVGAWGPIRGMWEGAAADDEVRFAGSSGGVASALAIHGLERLGYRLVLHIGADPQKPYLNRTVASRTRNEVLSRTGSRYAPASPCDSLDLIEEADGPCIFIGKPCDVAAAQKARRLRPKLDKNLALTVAFFCAGTPSTGGTLEVLRRLGISDPDDVSEVRYRGNGWPGKFVAKSRSSGEIRACTYEESWGDVLSDHVQWRCKLCLDHTGEFADISVGDPWYRTIQPGEPGSSLIIARTTTGVAYIERALRDESIVASIADHQILPQSQPNLLRTRGAVWGRMLGARLCGARVPRYRGLHSFGLFVSQLSLGSKVRAVLGAMRRSLRQGIAFKAPFQ